MEILMIFNSMDMIIVLYWVMKRTKALQYTDVIFNPYKYKELKRVTQLSLKTPKTHPNGHHARLQTKVWQIDGQLRANNKIYKA